MFNTTSANNVDVRIKLADGSTVDGAIPGGVTSDLATVLNRPGSFLELITASGQKRYIGSNHVMTVEKVAPLKQPKAPNSVGANSKTAHAILGLEQGYSAADLRTRYHQMVKMYHPDKYESVDLPPELDSYVREMFEAVGRAHDELSANLKNTAA